MSKAILEFNLPEESEQFDNAVNGDKYKAFIQEFDNYLRQIVKHSQDVTEEERKIYREIRESYNSMISDNNLDI